MRQYKGPQSTCAPTVGKLRMARVLRGARILSKLVATINSIVTRVIQLTLTLFMPWISTDHTNGSIPPDDLAVPADFLYRCSNFHFSVSK
jgi:hypothetical protein